MLRVMDLTHLIVRGKNELENDDEADKGRLRIKAKRPEQNRFLDECCKNHETHEQVHLE